MTQPLRLLAAAGALFALSVALTSSTATHGAPPRDVVVANPANDPALVRVVADDSRRARQPYQAKMRILLPDGQCCDNAFPAIPPGKRLVIEYASAWGFANGQQDFNYEVGTRHEGETTFTTHYLPVVQQGGGANTVAIAGQSMPLFGESANVMLRAGRSGAGEATIWMTVSGYLVDVP